MRWKKALKIFHLTLIAQAISQKKQVSNSIPTPHTFYYFPFQRNTYCGHPDQDGYLVRDAHNTCVTRKNFSPTGSR